MPRSKAALSLAGIPGLFLCPVLFVFAVSLQATSFQGRYRIAIGDVDNPIREGTIWVYGTGWGWIAPHEVAKIRDGIAEISLNAADFPFVTDDGVPAAEKLLVAIELGDGSWYRGPDHPPSGQRSGDPRTTLRTFVTAFGSYFHQLGRLDSLENGTITLILPPLVERRITLLHEDGSPVVGKKVRTELYIGTSNHCGVHMGLLYLRGEAHSLTTDDRGQITFRSQPGFPLYLDVSWWPKISPGGSLWVWREYRTGIRTDGADDVVLRSRWQHPEHKTVSLAIRDHNGHGVVGLFAHWKGALRGCGIYSNGFGPSDSKGVVSMSVPTETTKEIYIRNPNFKKGDPWKQRILRSLTEDERGRLLRNGRLTVTLDPPP